MENNISLVETDKIDDKIKIVVGQTDYSKEEAKNKLQEFNYDEIAVIKSYLGISNKKTTEIKSVNQEIYKQLRYRLDSTIREYNERADKNKGGNLLK